jgi:hypothetical protein
MFFALCQDFNEKKTNGLNLTCTKFYGVFGFCIFRSFIYICWYEMVSALWIKTPQNLVLNVMANCKKTTTKN